MLGARKVELFNHSVLSFNYRHDCDIDARWRKDWTNAQTQRVSRLLTFYFSSCQ